MEWTVNKLSLELKRDRRTIGKAISSGGVKPIRKKGRVKYYSLADVVNALFNTGELDLEQERAKLAKKQQEKINIQIEQMQGDLVPAGEVKKAWTMLVAAMRARLLSIPTKAAPLVIVADTQGEAKEILRKQVHDALNELHSELKSIVTQKK